MRNGFLLLSCLALLPWLTGCQPAPGPAVSQTASGDGHGHSHAAGEHDHGEPHSHGDAPHGGTLFDWGGGAYHVEFVVDHQKQEATVYILGSDARTPASIPATEVQLALDEPAVELALVAVPLAGESGGKSSCFRGTHEALGTVREFSGTVSGLIDGTPYDGSFRELPGGHEH